MKILTEEQKKRENEKFFSSVINNLREGGKYCFPSGMAIYTKRGNKLYGTLRDLEKVRHLVSPEYFKENFSMEPIN